MVIFSMLFTSATECRDHNGELPPAPPARLRISTERIEQKYRRLANEFMFRYLTALFGDKWK